MSIFAVMIRVKADKDYSTRHGETVDAIRKEAGKTALWEEPTSTFIFESTKMASELCDAIYYASPLHEERDLIAVINLSTKGPNSHAQRGAEYPATFDSLMTAR